MRLAIISDLHLGYARFEPDSYIQAERAFEDASKKADIILCAGDIFDIKIPKLETLKRAIEIFNKATVPVYAIHGNHERRSRDMVNPVQLLEAGTGMRVLHGASDTFTKDGETVQILGMGSVPEEYAEEALKKTMERFAKKEGAFSILMVHQSVRELVPGGKDELSLDYLETLPFDLIIDGHIHETVQKLGGKFLIPGSTVITQLKKEEMARKGYFLFDTRERKAQFIEIESRPFFYEEMKFEGATDSQVRERIRGRVDEIRKAHPDSLIAIKIDGTLKEGLAGSDIRLEGFDNVFIESRLNVDSLSARLEKIRSGREASLSVRDLALRELREKTAGKITLFDSGELFEKLVEGPEETMEYLEKREKKAGM